MAKIRRVLISVTDKTGIVDFARELTRAGRGARSPPAARRACCANRGIAVQDVAEVTGFPEMLDGRVKTMHPQDHRRHPGHARQRRTHAGARGARHRSRSTWWWSISTSSRRPRRSADATLEELIENIDIGGPTMIRSAAKNYQDVAVVVSPADYPADLRGTARERRRAVARNHAGGWRRRPSAPPPITIAPSARGWRRWTAAAALPAASGPARAAKLMDLRYGENPHQAAALYGSAGRGHRRRGAVARQGALLQQPGGSGRRLATGARVLGARPRPSSSTPTRAAARSRTRWPRLPQGARMRSGLGVRRRHRHSTARWTKRRRARSPSCSSKPSPRRTIRPRRWRFCRPRRICG